VVSAFEIATSDYLSHSPVGLAFQVGAGAHRWTAPRYQAILDTSTNHVLDRSNLLPIEEHQEGFPHLHKASSPGRPRVGRSEGTRFAAGPGSGSAKASTRDFSRSGSGTTGLTTLDVYGGGEGS
jgi:hypothetical protein